MRRTLKPLTCALITLFLPIAASCQDPKGPVPLSGTAKSAEGWKTEVVLSGLDHPWSMAWLPDGTMLITERPGRIRQVKNGVVGEPLKGVPKVLSRGQGGLMDIALHPRFVENRFVYFTYSAGEAEANRTTLARGKFTGDSLEEVKILYQNPDPKPGTQHFGSRIAWLGDGTLLMSIGDGGNPPTSLNGGIIRRYAQDPSKAFGKILRLTEDGTAPPDNPFVGFSGKLPEIFSYGHRNIQGLFVEAATQTIWANEHGSSGGDEINRIERGANYGWPVVSYSNEYTGGHVAEVTSRPDVKDPVVVWTPSIAPSGMTIYSGTRFPKWKGDLFSGALAHQQVRRTDLEAGRAVGEEALLIGKRVRDVRQGPDGELYILTDEDKGELLRIVPSQ